MTTRILERSDAGELEFGDWIWASGAGEPIFVLVLAVLDALHVLVIEENL